MKLTKQDLQKIIKAEVNKVLSNSEAENLEKFKVGDTIPEDRLDKDLSAVVALNQGIAFFEKNGTVVLKKYNSITREISTFFLSKAEVKALQKGL